MEKYVAVIVVTKDNKLALQKRDNKPNISNPGKVTAWGGLVDKKEQPIQAAIRELKEELTVKVKKSQLELFLKFKKYSPWLKKNLLAHIFVLKGVDRKDLKYRKEKKLFTSGLN